MTKEKLKQYYDCWSAAWSQFRHWMELTDDWKKAAIAVRDGAREFVKKHEAIHDFAETTMRNLIREADDICRSHDGTRKVTTDEIRPYYELWTDAWKSFRQWVMSGSDDATVEESVKDYCKRWATKGHPRFAPIVIAELEMAYKENKGDRK